MIKERLEKIENHLIEMKRLIVEANSLPDDKSFVYTISQACESLGWSRSKLRQQMKLGKIRFHKNGKRVLILKRELIEDISKS